MIANYEVLLKVNITHDIEGMDGLKDNKEMSEDIAKLICDEVTTAGGVATYEIIESKIDIKENVNNIIYNDFVKNSYR